jgi:recombination protein RecA
MLNDEALALMAAINKNFGPETVVLGSDMRVSKRFTTGSLALDVALGGGLAANHWAEVVGWSSAGKTAFALKTIAANQVLDPDYTTFWVAAERYDYDQAKALGVDNDRVIVADTNDMGPAFSLMLAAMESQAATCIVLDSYPALITKEEDEKMVDEFVMAVGARMTGTFVKKSIKAGHRSPLGTDRPYHGIFINQYRDKPGAFAPKFGSPPKGSPGGNAKDFFFYQRIEVARVKYLEENRPGIEKPVKVGQEIQYKTIKNKSGPPQTVARTDFYFRGAPILGFTRGEYDLAKEYAAIGIQFGVIKKAGPKSSWYEYGSDRWNGKAAVEDAVRTDTGLMARLRTDVLEIASNPELADKVSPEALEDDEQAPAPKRSARRTRS